MCGIVGQIGSKRVGEAGIQRMLNLLRHRGPDDHGIYIKAGVALGHRRLSIIDLSGGHQPISNEDKTLWVVCNGEIYNYQELRVELENGGHMFSTRSDTEVILHLYEDMGERCVERLRGMFAFALWDEKRQRLFAARDRLGQKPFFFVQRGTELLFASEIKALLGLDPSLAEIDLASLDQYLTLRIIAPPRSMFRAIQKLPPAHSLTFEAHSGLRIRRYWNLSYEPKLKGSEDDLVDELEERLIECLKIHLVSDVPVGSFLSGGIDSTLLVAMAMKHVVSEPLQTFSGSVPYGEYEEAPYARLVAQRYRTAHHEKTIKPSVTRLLPQLVWHLDEPSDPLSVCMYLIAEMARKHVKVVLGGDGGDELFGGYDRYFGYRYASSYAVLPRALRKYAISPLLALVPDGGWYKSNGHQLKWLHEMSFLRGSERYTRSLGYFYFERSFRKRLYGPVMRQASGSFDPGAPIREAFDRAPASEAIDRMLYADSQIRLPDHPVMILDRMTMAHGLEARSPYMDHELAEFAARLPTRLKVRGRSLRYIQMRLAQRYLPKPLLERPKQGFNSPLPYMLKDEYKFLFGIFLRNAHLAREGMLLQEVIDGLLDEHYTGRADHGSRLWLLLNSEVWYRMFIEGHSVDELSGQITERAGVSGSETVYPGGFTQRPTVATQA